MLGASAEADVVDTIPLPNPVLDLEGAAAKLKLENTVGADVRFTFDTLAFDGVQMQHPSFYGVHDMARAQWINGELYSTTELEIDLGETGQTKDGYAKELTAEQIDLQRAGMKKDNNGQFLVKFTNLKILQ